MDVLEFARRVQKSGDTVLVHWAEALETEVTLRLVTVARLLENGSCPEDTKEDYRDLLDGLVEGLPASTVIEVLPDVYSAVHELAPKASKRLDDFMIVPATFTDEGIAKGA